MGLSKDKDIMEIRKKITDIAKEILCGQSRQEEIKSGVEGKNLADKL
jgi:hypothetical protein